ncbi:hypothetical protein O1611_g8797 [Lasiodiplodia mahajangana]|uniref:Uncharacterized protein n=1 Tax=Lasiodiplodia mahajangana TaxID=1108764 RepID=A0ACC2JBP0_9PEZI|nr:hypothetical protein O1611_g8797 [Lasiodiplodia mahajangana]
MADLIFVGWTSTLNVRGTADIIYSCAAVIITAIWAVLHLNIPAATDGTIRVLVRRVRWGITSILAPDLLTLVAASQWVSARRSVEQMKSPGNIGSWTIVHAFYADSGGFLFQAPGELAFPINAQCVHFLVSRGYIDMPAITRDEIWDKSKADVFAKAFAILQTSWIVIQSIARTATGLSISPLEIFTLAFVVSTAMSYYFWWNKPQHVATPTTIQCKFPISQILAGSGIPLDTPYVNTPLDFVDDSSRVYERRDLFRNFGLKGKAGTNTDIRTPLHRMPDDAILPAGIPLYVYAMLAIPSLIHSSIHLLAWNHAFPTTIEQTLWRISAISLASVSVVNFSIVRVLTLCGFQGKFNLTWVWVNMHRQESSNRRWFNFWDVLLGSFTLILIIARHYIIVEAIISLRKSPVDAYTAVNWTGFLPHI